MSFGNGLARIYQLRAAFNAVPMRLTDIGYVTQKLQHMAEVDQEIINLGMDHGAYSDRRDQQGKDIHSLMNTVIAENTVALKSILAVHDWAAIAAMGKDAASHAWLLVQHADHDPWFQAKILKDMERFNLNDSYHYAYLYDRVAMNTGRPQYYGTQFQNGQPYPIEDPDNLDTRRAAMGLMDMAEYRAVMAEHQAHAQAPKPSL